jgi:hypothetical protein
MSSPLIEASVINALEAIKNNPKLSLRAVASIYSVPYTTLHRRHANIPLRRDIPANSRKFTDLEENTIV